MQFLQPSTVRFPAATCRPVHHHQHRAFGGGYYGGAVLNKVPFYYNKKGKGKGAAPSAAKPGKKAPHPRLRGEHAEAAAEMFGSAGAGGGKSRFQLQERLVVSLKKQRANIASEPDEPTDFAQHFFEEANYLEHYESWLPRVRSRVDVGKRGMRMSTEESSRASAVLGTAGVGQENNVEDQTTARVFGGHLDCGTELTLHIERAPLDAVGAGMIASKMERRVPASMDIATLDPDALTCPVEWPYGAIFDPQEKVLTATFAAIAKRKHALLGAPPGTGKTAALLAGALAAQKFLFDVYGKAPQIVYGTRTHGQIAQVLKEIECSPSRPSVTTVGSRAHANFCVEPTVVNGGGAASRGKTGGDVVGAECAMGCKDAVEQFAKDNGFVRGGYNSSAGASKRKGKKGQDKKERPPPSCGRLHAMVEPRAMQLPGEVDPQADSFARAVLTEDVVVGEDEKGTAPYQLLRDDFSLDNYISRTASDLHGCPLYLSRAAAYVTDVVVAPYNFILDPGVREATFPKVSWLSGKILILDEAHNVEGFCRDAFSFSLQKIPSGSSLGWDHWQRTLEQLQSCVTEKVPVDAEGVEDFKQALTEVLNFVLAVQKFCATAGRQKAEERAVLETFLRESGAGVKKGKRGGDMGDGAFGPLAVLDVGDGSGGKGTRKEFWSWTDANRAGGQKFRAFDCAAEELIAGGGSSSFASRGKGKKGAKSASSTGAEREVELAERVLQIREAMTPGAFFVDFVAALGLEVPAGDDHTDEGGAVDEDCGRGPSELEASRTALCKYLSELVDRIIGERVVKTLNDKDKRKALEDAESVAAGSPSIVKSSLLVLNDIGNVFCSKLRACAESPQCYAIGLAVDKW